MVLFFPPYAMVYDGDGDDAPKKDDTDDVVLSLEDEEGEQEEITLEEQ